MPKFTIYNEFIITTLVHYLSINYTTIVMDNGFYNVIFPLYYILQTFLQSHSDLAIVIDNCLLYSNPVQEEPGG